MAEGGRVSPPWTLRGDAPKVIAVLPFENISSEADIELLVRESFYSHLSALNFYDIELSKVDSILKMIKGTAEKPWQDLPPPALGDFLHADLIVYGKVLYFKKMFLGIYSQIAIEVSIEIVDCRSAEGKWRKTLIQRSHDGGLPFDLYSVAPAAVRSGLHMKKEKAVELIDRINRELVADIPNPTLPPASPTIIEVQVASFMDREKAERTINHFHGQGLKAWIREVTLGTDQWHRVMLGPFYSEKEAENVRVRVKQSTTFAPFLIHRKPEDSK